MKHMFSIYPEVLFIDATYKLNDLHMPLYILLAIDGNGESEIVCLWVVQSEDKVTITNLFVEFKKVNENATLIQCVMTDKDMTERDVIKEQFPQAALAICLFHTLRTMRREISCDKLGISQGERVMCLELFSKMAYSKSEEAYQEYYEELSQSAPRSVLDYFESNWHCIRNEWVDGLKNTLCNFMNQTNNRLESINGKLKAVITRYSGMVQFFNDLMQCIKSLKLERDHRALQVTMKRRVYSFTAESVLGKYSTVLTPYAFEFVNNQLQYSQKVTVRDDIDNFSCSIDSSEGQLVTSTVNCSCTFITSMKLPCCHIFAVRRHKGLNEYTEDVCAERWKLCHFLQHHRAYQQDSDTVGEDDVGVNEEEFSGVGFISTEHQETSVILTEQEKYKKAFKVIQSLAQQLSCWGMKEFEEGLHLLKVVESMWEQGKNLTVVDVDSSDKGQAGT